MNFFRIFRRRQQREPKPLRIEGIKTPLTPQPDDAELAAQAILETLASSEQSGRSRMHPRSKKKESGTKDAEYYRSLSDRIREGRAAEKRMAMRFVAYCEERLSLTRSHHVEGIAELEQGLYKWLDTVEREGGELKRRWQHCLAEVTVMELGLDKGE